MQFKQVSALRAQFPAGAVAVREGDGHSEGLLLAELCSSSKSVRCAHNFLPGQWLPGRLIPAGIVQYKQVSALRAQFQPGQWLLGRSITRGIVQYKQVSALCAQFPAGTVAAREVMPSGIVQFKQVSALRAQFPAGAVAVREGDGHSEGLLLAELCSSSKSVRCAHNFQPGQ